ncbi:hypothetical protein [Cerasicoccus fimbriatus]|uniref:hypothetical protein n=1 Tax=Cerasicoccus fimbriatus TaxID=3014554 RepID=UPI0022B5DB9F|nr:hypothetical protein [Cerasicoccus sp. TK19100]
MKKGCLIIFAAVALGIVALIGIAWFGLTHYETGINEKKSNLDWLPAAAEDVTYYEGSMNQQAEFSIDKDAFLRWCEEMERPLQKITEKEKGSDYSVSRPRRMLEHAGELEPIPDSERSDDFEEYFSHYRKEFDIGDYYYSLVYRNSGGYWIGYDVGEGRAYYQHAHN